MDVVERVVIVMAFVVTAGLAAADKPNVLFIAVDDMRVELGCYGDSISQSPHIDRLAARGVRFDRAYCQQAVCNPSRASLMTGLRPTTLTISNLETHFREVRPDVVTLPQWFQRRGYFTQNIGKIYHNWRQDAFRGDPASWSVPAVMHYASHGKDLPQGEGRPASLIDLPRAEMCEVEDEAYFDGRIANLAVGALEQLQDRPFFLAVGFWKPHAPFNAPARYWRQYERDAVSLPEPAQPPSDVPAIAMHDCREIFRGFKDRPGGRPTAEEERALRHGYYAAISFVDAQIGKVLDALDRLDLSRRTIVVLWSDHGYHLGEKSLWAKTSNFELDARVPLILAGPGISVGGESEALVELLDLYPTLAELCQLPTPKDIDGKSFRGVCRNPAEHHRAAAFTTHPRPAYVKLGESPDAMGYSARTDQYRYTEWRDTRSNAVVAAELYDHTADPRESRNVVGSSDFADVVETHRALIRGEFSLSP